MCLCPLKKKSSVNLPASLFDKVVDQTGPLVKGMQLITITIPGNISEAVLYLNTLAEALRLDGVPFTRSTWGTSALLLCPCLGFHAITRNICLLICNMFCVWKTVNQKYHVVSIPGIYQPLCEPARCLFFPKQMESPWVIQTCCRHCVNTVKCEKLYSLWISLLGYLEVIKTPGVSCWRCVTAVDVACWENIRI